MCSSNGALPAHGCGPRTRIFSTRFSSWPFLAGGSLGDSWSGVNGGKDASAEATRAIRRGEQGARNCSADYVYVANASGKGTLRCFKVFKKFHRVLFFSFYT